MVTLEKVKLVSMMNKLRFEELKNVLNDIRQDDNKRRIQMCVVALNQIL